MSDLLPEFWLDQKAEEETAKRANRSSAKKRVQDINVWLQCYAVYVGVMATKSPKMVPELMAYMIAFYGPAKNTMGSLPCKAKGREGNCRGSYAQYLTHQTSLEF